jgi:hypothetical protein
MSEILTHYLKSKPIIGDFLVEKFVNNKQNKFTNTENDNTAKIVGRLIQYVVLLFSIYLAWRCSAGFWGYFFAVFVPELYIIYKLAADGMCGLLSKSPVIS